MDMMYDLHILNNRVKNTIATLTTENFEVLKPSGWNHHHKPSLAPQQLSAISRVFPATVTHKFFAA